MGPDWTLFTPDTGSLFHAVFHPTAEGWLYVAVVLDIFSRKVVGWAMREAMPQQLTLDALRMAIANRRPDPGLLHHSDRGSQYAAHEYRRLLDTHGMLCSMSRQGHDLDRQRRER